MTGRIDRINRLLILLFGLACIAGSVIIYLLSFSVFGSRRAHSAILTANTRHFVDRNHGWLWLAVGAGLVILGLLALWWLLAQLRTSRVGNLDVERERSRGTTKLQSAALSDAAAREVEEYSGVVGANGRLLGNRAKPVLRLDVALSDQADVGALRQRIEQEALAHAKQAASLDRLESVLRLSVAPTERPAPQ